MKPNYTPNGISLLSDMWKEALALSGICLNLGTMCLVLVLFYAYPPQDNYFDNSFFGSIKNILLASLCLPWITVVSEICEIRTGWRANDWSWRKLIEASPVSIGILLVSIAYLSWAHYQLAFAVF